MRSEIARRAARLTSIGAHVPRSVRASGQRLRTTPIEEFSLTLAVEAGERLAIAVESIASEPIEGSALLELRMLSASGVRVSIPGWPDRSNRVSEYRYLEAAGPGEISLTLLDLLVPDLAVRFEIGGQRWKKAVATAVVGSPVVNRSSDRSWTFETESGAKLEHSATLLDRRLTIPTGSTRVELRIDHVARGRKSSGPVAVTAFDDHGAELLPLPSLPQHPVHGPIVQLSGAPDEHLTKLVSFDVPAGATSVRVRGIEWGPQTAFVSGDVSLLGTASAEGDVASFISSIPVDATLLVIDTTAPPMGHATLGLRPNNLAEAYARAGRWVIFLPFSSLQEFSNEAGERIFQIPRSEVGSLWSALRTHRRGAADHYICSSFPSLESLASAQEAKRLGWSVTYEVRDDMEEFNRVGYSKWYSPLLEQQMLRVADRVVSVSRALDEKMETMQPRLGGHVVIPNGVRSETIERGAFLRTRATADERQSSAILGYVGHLTPSWFDWPMLIRVAKAVPHVRFEIVGHGMPPGLEPPENVVHLGAKTHEELAEIVVHWRAGIIPFRDIPLTRSVDPNKIYEYFAWGLPCITVDMGAVREYPWTRVYHDANSFVEHIGWALETAVNDDALLELERFLKTVDWDSRAEQMLAYLEDGTVA